MGKNKMRIKQFICQFMILILFVLLTASWGFAAVGDTTRVSVDSAGSQANGSSTVPSISGDGSYVAFASYARNLVTGDTNNNQDVFIHDSQTGQTIRVSISSAGIQGNNNSGNPSISSDGRYVAFSSNAYNLVAGDTNKKQDVFVHDRQTGQTTRVSISSAGIQGNGSSYDISLSGDGRYVAFTSQAKNLVTGDTNNKRDIFVHDRQTSQTTRVSINSSGLQGSSNSINPSISFDGRHVSFASSSTNLVSGDTNSATDVFVHDRQTGETTRVSVDSAGNQGNGASYNPSISSNGSYVVFESSASNLVSGDTNVVQDIFMHDRLTGETTRVSLDSSGNQSNGASINSAISSSGSYVVFESSASNLVSGDTNAAADIFVHDSQTGETTRVSLDSAGNQSNGAGNNSSISSDGKFQAFQSSASNLISGDTNGVQDVFVHEYLGISINYYCDNDNDGYIDLLVDGTCTQTSCVPAGCQETQGDDCDDNDNSIYPGATEICDGKDNDCDGSFDEGLQYTLTTSANPAEGGSITPECSGGCVYNCMETIDLTAIASFGYSFSSWTGCAPASDRICTVTMDIDRNLTANFEICYISFPDVPSGYWAEDYIKSISCNKITTGYADGTYKPANNIIRAEMSAFIIRAKYGDDFIYGDVPYFPDVSSGHWAFKYIQKMYEDGISTGYADGTYRPANNVNRAEMAAFIIRAKYGEDFIYSSTPYFSDVSSGYWAFAYIQKLYEDGVSTGYADGTYMPANNVNRAEMAAFLARAFLGMP